MSSPAADAAAGNWLRNLEALAALQPRVVERLPREEPDVEWVYGRDGSITALEPGGQWYAGCSLPREAARFMLKSMEAGGNVACFLSPLHAAQLRIALDLLRPHQAVIAIVPQLRTMQMILRADDFSPEFLRHRLWFACGESWADDLKTIFGDHEGLPTPSQFIRPIVADPAPLDRLIAPAQQVFAEEMSRRARLVDSLRHNCRPAPADPRRLCVIAPSQFRLWDNAGRVLAESLRQTGDASDLSVIDSDDPLQASPVALGRACADADSLVTADVSRGDLPGIAADDLPWVTWVTKGRIPSFSAAGPRDALLVADPAWKRQAVAAGWPGERVEVAEWPAVGLPPHSNSAPSELAIIADTKPLDPPDRVLEYSSHRLLWENIAQELTRDPFVLHDDPTRFLEERMARQQIADEGFDKPLFIDALIIPAYQQGLARALAADGLSLRLYGKGWDAIAGLSNLNGGELDSRETLDEILRGCAAVVHVWPSPHAHPIDAAGRPVLRRAGGSRASFLRDARAILQHQPPAGPSTKPSLEGFSIPLNRALRVDECPGQ